MSRMHRTARRRAAALAAAAALVLTGCGGEDTPEGASEEPAAASTSEAPASSSGSSSSAEAPAEDGGTVTITGVDFDFELEGTELVEFVNDGGASHNVRFELDGEDVAESEVIAPGESTTFTVTLEPGEYVLYCSVGNHRGMGMEVPVTVT